MVWGREQNWGQKKREESGGRKFFSGKKSQCPGGAEVWLVSAPPFILYVLTSFFFWHELTATSLSRTSYDNCDMSVRFEKSRSLIDFGIPHVFGGQYGASPYTRLTFATYALYSPSHWKKIRNPEFTVSQVATRGSGEKSLCVILGSGAVLFAVITNDYLPHRRPLLLEAVFQLFQSKRCIKSTALSSPL